MLYHRLARRNHYSMQAAPDQHIRRRDPSKNKNHVSLRSCGETSTKLSSAEIRTLRQRRRPKWKICSGMRRHKEAMQSGSLDYSEKFEEDQAGPRRGKRVLTGY